MRYDPATDHEPLFAQPLFDAPKPAQGGGSEMKTRTRSTPSVRQGKCPECATTGTTGIVRQGPHLVWRLHTRSTLSGARLDCRASGAPICQVAPKPLPSVTTPTCICEDPA